MPAPENFFPRKPNWSRAFLSLTGRDHHGYAIMQEVTNREAQS